MSEWKKKHERICDLLDGHVGKKEIATIVGTSLATVYNVAKAKAEGKEPAWAPDSGGLNKKWMPAFLADLKAKVKDDPTVSVRRLARDMNVSKGTMSTALKADLGLKSYTRTPRHLLTAAMKEKHLDRCWKIRSTLHKGKSNVMIFSNKKIFTVDQVYIYWNDRYLAQSTAEVKGVFQTKHLARSIWALWPLTSRPCPSSSSRPGRRSTAMCTSGPSGTLSCHGWKANYPNRNYTWTQDGAPAHTSKLAQDFCTRNMANFLESKFWPLSSLDLNPLDFAVWGILGEGVQQDLSPKCGVLENGHQVGVGQDVQGLHEEVLCRVLPQGRLRDRRQGWSN